MFVVYNYRTFEDYQYGHGTKVGERSRKEDALKLAKDWTYGGRECTSITYNGKPFMAIVNGQELKF